MTEPSRLRCAGCGWIAPPAEQQPYPFRCGARRVGDDIDHVVVRTPDPGAEWRTEFPDSNPFIRFRHRLHSYRLATSRGMSDDEYSALVRRLDASIAQIDGRGFTGTPWRRCERLSDRLGFSHAGGVFVKDETGNVTGSHKARHLMGIMLYLEVVRRLGLAPPSGARRSPRLAIASCGNAALAAAVVARAADWPLDVFVPESAEAAIVGRLQRLGASVTTCERRPGEKGDPSYLRFQEALSSGALPFSVQGSDNGLTIEGGETLAWEIIGGPGGTRLDRLFIQVGGGALASSCVQAFQEARSVGAVDHVPAFHAVQTRGAYPLARAHSLVAERLAAQGRPSPSAVEVELRYARTHRSQFMRPWETEPRSIAHGILDDETYDWAAVVEGMLLTGGSPVVVDEALLEEANALARETTSVNVDHTGSAGLAGLLKILHGPNPPSLDERVAVIFSGVKRG